MVVATVAVVAPPLPVVRKQDHERPISQTQALQVTDQLAVVGRALVELARSLRRTLGERGATPAQ